MGTRQTLLETKDGGNTWAPRSIASAEDEDFNYRFNCISFKGNEGWIIGKPAILLYTADAGNNWKRIPLSSQLPGDMVTISNLACLTLFLFLNVFIFRPSMIKVYSLCAAFFFVIKCICMHYKSLLSFGDAYVSNSLDMMPNLTTYEHFEDPRDVNLILLNLCPDHPLPLNPRMHYLKI